MAQKNQIDMLNGPLLKKILLFSLPLAASSVLQQLFNSIDVAVVGRFVGRKALAAVGANSPVISLLINLFVGISMGANAIISNQIGSGNDDGVRRSVSTVSVLALASGLFLAVLGVAVARPILELIDTPQEVLDMAVLYLRVYFLGMPFFMIFNFGSAVLRSKGDTRRPLYILVVAGIVNTVLNLIFVLWCGMGVEGVAIATGIANALSAAMIVVLMQKERGPLRLQLKGIRIYGQELRRILKIGVPAGLQGMVFSVSNVIVQATINTYGAGAVAGSSAALNFEFYCYFIVVAFNGAAICFIGQNYGAGQMQRVRAGIRFMSAAAMVYTFCAWLFAMFQPRLLCRIFTPDEAMVEASVRMLRVYFAGFFFQSFQFCGQSVFQSLGWAKYAITFSLLRKVVIVVPLTLLLPVVGLGTTGVFLAEPISNIVGGLACYITMLCTAYKQMGRE